MFTVTAYNFFHFHTKIDVFATQNWYATAGNWDCDCDSCRNFLQLAKRRALPPPVLDILDRLGVPPQKATYVCELSSNEEGHVYDFSYRIAGCIQNGEQTAPVSQDWGSFTCFHEIYPFGAPGFLEPHFDLGFSARLPWILDEPE